MAGNDIFPRLRLREVVLVLIVIIAGLTVLLVNVAVSGHVKVTGPAWKRLIKTGGDYELVYPRNTTLAQARVLTFRQFPPDTRTIFYVEKPFCATQIVTAPLLDEKVPPGTVDIEFLTEPKNPNAIPFFDKKNVDKVLVTLLNSPDQRPSC